MSNYIDTGISYIGKIPSNWGIKHFKYIIASKVDNRGRTPELNENNEGIPVIELDAIGNKIPNINIVKKFISEESYKKYIRNDLKAGDVLFGTVGSIGKSSIVPKNFNFCIAQNIVGYRFKEDQDQLFWYYYFQSETFKQTYIQFNKGNIQDSIKISDLERGTIITPPYKEQQIIANFLDKNVTQLDKIVDNINKQIDILVKMKKARVTEIVTSGLNENVEFKDSGIDWIGKIPKHWEIKRLKYLGTARNGLTYSPDDIVDENDGTLVLRSSNIQNGKLSFDDNVYVNCEIPENIRLRENDLLICSRNGSRNLIGKNALIDKECVNKTYGAFMSVYRSKYNKFIHYVLNSNIFEYYLNTFLTSTINQLTNSNLYSIKIPFTYDVDEQNEIVDYLDCYCNKIDLLIKSKQEQVENLLKYRQSMIYEYVTGKKKVGEFRNAE